MFLTSFICFHATAQSNQYIDVEEHEQQFYSTIDHLKNNPQDIQLKHWLSPYRVYDKNLMDNYYAGLAVDFKAKKDSLNRWQKMFWLFEIASIQLNYDSLEIAFSTFEQGLNLADKEQDINPYLYLKWGTAFIYRQTAQWEKSNNVLSELLEIAKSKNIPEEEIHYKYWMAENHQNLGEYQEALALANELYQVSINSGDLINACYDLMQLAYISSLVEVDTSYFEYYRMAIELGNKTESENIKGLNFIETGEAYFTINENEKALVLFKKAKPYYNHLTPREKVRFLNGFCSIYLTSDSIKLARSFVNKAISEVKKVESELWLAASNFNLAKCHIRTMQFDSAKICLLKTLEVYKAIDNEKDLAEVYQHLSDVYFKQNQYNNALLYLDSAHLIDNKRIKNYNANVLAKLRTDADYYLQKEKISELVISNKNSRAKAKRLRETIVAITFLLLISITFFLVSRKQLLKQKEFHVNLVKKNIELDQLNKQYYECENKPVQKLKSKEIKNEDYLYKRVNKLLHTDEIFTNSDLTLKSLAEVLKTNTTYLSSIINSKYNCNLKTLINKLRVSKAKEILVSEKHKHFSMEGIAIEVGFRSRSAFYLSFKAHTGLNPTQYREALKQTKL